MDQVRRTVGVCFRLAARDAGLRFPGLYTRYQLGELERLRRRIRPSYEAEIRALARLRNIIAGFEQIVDVGANFGQSAWAFAYHYPGAQIVAFEANPLVATRCRALLGSKVLSVDALAIGAEEGSVVLKVPIYRGIPFPGLASIDEPAARNWFNPALVRGFSADQLKIEAVTCRQVRLDSFSLKPDLLKIDVEGAELAVLKGALATIKASRPVILAECSGTYREVAEFLAPHGYRALELRGRRWHASLGRNLNRLFVPIDRLPEEAGRDSQPWRGPTEKEE